MAVPYILYTVYIHELVVTTGLSSSIVRALITPESQGRGYDSYQEPKVALTVWQLFLVIGLINVYKFPQN